MSQPMPRIIAVRLPEDLAQAVTEAALLSHLSVSDVVRLSLRNTLNPETPPVLSFTLQKSEGE